MKILVSAGPTREPVDPVRYISNRSSGKMGYALAAAALRRGHEVTLVSGPTALEAPPGARLLRVETAEEMLQSLQAALPGQQVLIMAAAVADWRPAVVAPSKLKKQAGPPVIRLEPTPDILLALSPLKGQCLFIGFAAETDDLLRAARAKLTAKGLDCIVANDVSRRDIGFDVEYNQVSLLFAEGRTEHWPRLTKTETAERLIREAELAVKALPSTSADLVNQNAYPA